MNLTYDYLRGLLGLAVLGGGVLALMIWAYRRGTERKVLILQWLLTVPILLGLIFIAAPAVAQGGYGGAFFGIPATAVCGLFLAFIWRSSLTNIVAKPLAALYDGGDVEIEPRAYYSAAIARRKSGKTDEAIAEIQRQLEKFPADFEGQLLLAAIQAEDLKDLPAAALTVERFLNQEGHTAPNIAYALNSLADWHLKIGQDAEAARQALEQLAERFPESEWSNLAAQRIAHLPSAAQMADRLHPLPLPVPLGPADLGLTRARAAMTATPPRPSDRTAAELVKHLEAHPLDTEAREKLAVLYADQFHRLDLAADQLEQLIAHPNQPHRQIAHWLNLLADLQIRHGASYETVKATLERISELMPTFAAASLAQNRIARLKLEFKALKPDADVKFGTYEQDLGLNRERSDPRH